MEGYEVKFNIYAESQEEADIVTGLVKDFISDYAKQGIAVTADKVSQAIRKWGSNSFLRNQIKSYFR